MPALILAGGAGKRLNLGEKPLVMVGDRPMVGIVVSVFETAGYDPVIITSPRTPFTRNWARVQGYDCFQGSGKGYVDDIREAVESLELQGPVFTCVSDLPCIAPEHIRFARSAYDSSGKEALSAWVPASFLEPGDNPVYTEPVDGEDAIPAGLNIIRGDLMHRVQEEKKLLIRDIRLAHNVNSRADLEKVRKYFRDRPVGSH